MYSNCTDLRKVYRIQIVGDKLLVHAYGVSYGIFETFTKKDFKKVKDGYTDVYVNIFGKKSTLVWKD